MAMDAKYWRKNMLLKNENSESPRQVMAQLCSH